MRALLVGLFAFCLVTQASAAAMQGETTLAPRKAKVEQRALTLDERLERKVAALRKYRGTIRFFESRRSLLSRGRPANAGALVARVREEARSTAHEDRRRASRRGSRAQDPEARVTPATRSHLQRVRVVLPGGARHRMVRVAPLDEGAERPVPRPLPDGLVRAPAVRPRRDRPRPGRRGAPILRALRSGLEPLGLSLGSVLGSAKLEIRGGTRISSSHRASLFVANCTPAPRRRVSLGAVHLVGVPATCGDSGSATAFGHSMRLPHTRAVTASATRTSAS